MQLSEDSTPLEKYYDHKCDLLVQNLSSKRRINLNLFFNEFSFEDRKSMKQFLDKLVPIPFEDEAKYNQRIFFDFNHPNVLPIKKDEIYDKYPIYSFEENLDVLLSYKNNIVDEIFYNYLENLKIFKDEPNFLQND